MELEIFKSVGWLLMRMLKRDSRQPGDEQQAGSLRIDPICGMQVDPRAAVATEAYKGKRYYFCSIACRDDFRHAGSGSKGHGCCD